MLNFVPFLPLLFLLYIPSDEDILLFYYPGAIY